MGWHIKVVANELSLTKKQATQLVGILEATWNEWETYREWIGDKDDLIGFFTGKVKFIDDFMEHMDHFKDPEVQAAFLQVGAKGFVTIGDFEGDQRGHVWTHAFEGDAYNYEYGSTRNLVDGRVQATPTVVRGINTSLLNQSWMDGLKAMAPFDGNTFVLTGELDTMDRSVVTDAIEAMGGRVSSSLSSKTFALIQGSAPGPAKIAKAQKQGTSIWDEDMLLITLGLKTAIVTSVSDVGVVAQSKTPFGWYFEEVHIKSGDIVNTGFSRTDITDIASKVKGFQIRIMPVFAA